MKGDELVYNVMQEVENFNNLSCVVWRLRIPVGDVIAKWLLSVSFVKVCDFLLQKQLLKTFVNYHLPFKADFHLQIW